MSGEAADNGDIIYLYFDGRKKQTVVQKKVGATYSKETIQKEHTSLIEEAGSKYFSTSKQRVVLQMQQLIDHFTSRLKKEQSENSIVEFGCDGTVVNIGAK